ncbi:hypothetical protein BJX63DRAFT_208180 [Aspergillus granulosus]|uniref:Uncharacterized protein n=1 Tax=Aspergillus granulosus TaxID=176169 RepID=A0ABR4HEH5_9EURO
MKKKTHSTPAQEQVIEPNPRDVQAFYQIIWFSRSVNIVRGNRIKPIHSAESDGVDLAKCRRDFADAIAYFSISDGDPDHVTAVALGEKESKVILWIASNTNVRSKVVDFLETDVLCVVQELACAQIQGQLPPSENKRGLGLLERVLEFNSDKNLKYYKVAVWRWEDINKSTDTEGKSNPALDYFNEWFKATFYKDGTQLAKADMPKLAWRCYALREGQAFDILRHFSSQGNEHSPNFEQLHKLLYKLGKHIGLFHKMLRAVSSLREVFRRGFVVEPIPAEPKRKPLPSLMDQTVEVENIVTRVFPDKDERNQFYHHIDQFYNLNMEKIKELLGSWANNSVRVHAEILLVDYLYKTSGKFLDNNDKYIGCSKPACYLCYQYICQHPGKYTRPPSHQKLYHHWALPAVQTDDPNLSVKDELHKRFMSEITETLRSELRNEVRRHLAPTKYHADSTAGASSVADISRVSSKAFDSLFALIRKTSEEKSALCDDDLDDGGVMVQG